MGIHELRRCGLFFLGGFPLPDAILATTFAAVPAFRAAITA
jgi:hypothetical protein